MTHRLSVIPPVVVCLLVVLAGSFHGKAKSHDVSVGMRIDDALLVAKRCVIEATAFNDPRKRQFYKELRAQDTLEYAGITNAARLNSLRRYIVRNNDIGVQSIYGVRLGEKKAYPYLIPNSALAGIKQKWTIEQLAREIIKSAGLPYMTYAKASKITANCRYLALTPKDPHTEHPLKNEKDPPVLDTKINGDIRDRDKFYECLVEKKGKLGIESAGIIDGEGDYYPYIADRLTDVKKHVETGTYKDLIKYLHDDARVDLATEISSEIIVRNWFVPANCKEVSFPIETFCLQKELRDRERTFDTQTLGELGTSLLKVSTASSTLLTFRKDQKSDPQPVPDLSGIELLDRKTIRDLTGEVKDRLEGKR